MERAILFLRRIRIMKNIKEKKISFFVLLFFSSYVEYVRKHRSIFIQYEKKKIVTIQSYSKTYCFINI